MACGKDGPNPPPSGGAGTTGAPPDQTENAGKSYYTTKVDPFLTKECKSCHANGTQGAPVYLDATPDGSYEKLKNFPKIYSPTSILLTKGKHVGPALSAEAAQIVTVWLGIEFGNVVGGGDTGGDSNVAIVGQAVQAFADCMSFGDWQDSGMQGWSLLQSVGFGPCVGCHQQGNAGTFLNDDEQVTYDNNRVEPWVYRLVIAQYASGEFTGLVGSQRLIEKGSAPCFDQDNVVNQVCHPVYNTPNVLKQALLSFESQTFAKIQNNECLQPEPYSTF
jgi:hypothetical protein